MSDWVPTTCMRCAVGCGHLQRGADIGTGIDVVRGDAAHPVNQGLACQRGVRETSDPQGEWLTRPMVRRDGELVSTTWDVALSEALRAFQGAVDSAGEVAVLGSGQQTNEAAYALGKLARGGFGTRYYDANTTLCMASAVTAYYQAFGSDAPPCSYDDIPEAEAHVVWGANPAAAHPVMFRWIRQAASDEGVELLAVDPVETETAEAADAHVAPDPGQDLALARAVLARIVETDRVDEGFVAEATEGFDDLRDALPDSESAAARAGVSTADVDRLADAFERDALCYWGMGVNQHVQGTDIARALIDLCLATGNLRPGSGPFSLTGQANSMGTRVCSCKGTWPGQRPFADPDERRTVAEQWDIPVERLPPDPGPGPVGIAEALGDEVEVAYTVATNPVAGMPDASTAKENLEDVFLVAQDAFRTETTDLADVVLPAATWGESEGTAMNMERTVSRVRAATEAPSGVWSDLRIISTVGARLFPDLFDDPDPDPEALFDEFAGLTAGTVADMSGITYDRLEDLKALRWPAPDAETDAGYRYYDGDDGNRGYVPRDEDEPAPDETGEESWSFPTASGLAGFSTARQEGLPEPVDDEYPLTLTTARESDAYNTGVRSRDVDDLDPVVARINPETVAESDAIRDGEVVVESRRDAVRASVDPDAAVPEGLVWLPIHHPATNRLTIDALDPQSKEPNFKQCAVRLVAPADETAATADAPVRADD
ncbi:assimilatory nitrate reductase NasA [Halosimplex aquaticum]|uniref:Assimilatory nitrate reductase NasA n=1 Tax=Halosimplex aquaticum TaxID=3026162 RepID=A0ABD5Y1Y8_9EURY|nr:assimilatory nitrate reductase NasA [Halosimplex aquaticum]